MEVSSIKVYSRQSGETRTIYLTPGISSNDMQALLKSCFDESYGGTVSGFVDIDSNINFPFSSICLHPSMMHGKHLEMLFSGTTMRVSPSLPRDARNESPNNEGINEDSLLDDTALTTDYTGGNVSVVEARSLLGLEKYSPPDDVLGYLMGHSDRDGTITKERFKQGLLSLMGEKYVRMPMDERVKVDFVLDRLFSVFTTFDTNQCMLSDLGCALMIFCGGTSKSRAHAAFALLVLLENSDANSRLDLDAESNDALHLLVMVRSMSSLLKASKCLNPASRLDNCSHEDHTAARQALQHFMGLEEGQEGGSSTEYHDYQPVYLHDFALLFSDIIDQLESGVTDEDLDLSQPSSSPKQQPSFLRDNLASHWPDSYDSQDGDGGMDATGMLGGGVFGSFSDSFDGGEKDQTQQEGKCSTGKRQSKRESISSMHVAYDSSGDDTSDSDYDTSDAERDEEGDDDDSSEDGDEDGDEDEYDDDFETLEDEYELEDVDVDEDEDEGGCQGFLDDDAYPPSAVVLELRAAQSVLGLDDCKAEDMMETLGAYSEQGTLDLEGWLSWLQKRISSANIWEQDIAVAMNLGSKLFEGVSKICTDGIDLNSITYKNGNIKNGSGKNRSSNGSNGRVLFAAMAVGLSFLCGQSPLGDKVMVAFTLMDEDGDSCITREEFTRMILSVLTVVTVCSRLAANKTLVLHTSLNQLAQAAAQEAVVAMGEENADADELLTLDMVCEVAVDFLKVAAIY